MTARQLIAYVRNWAGDKLPKDDQVNLSDRLEKAKRERLALRQRDPLVLGQVRETHHADAPVDAPTDADVEATLRPALHDAGEPIRLDDYRPVKLSEFAATFNPPRHSTDHTLDDWMVKAHREEQLREERLHGLYELITREREERFTIDLTDERVGSAPAEEPEEEVVLILDPAPSDPSPSTALPRRTPLVQAPARREIDPRFEQYARRVLEPADTGRPAAEPTPQEQPMNRYRSLNAAQPTPTAGWRGRRHARQKTAAPRAAQHLCPQCGSIARIDIHDPFRGRLHLSCNVCFKTW